MWASNKRLEHSINEPSHFTVAPELVVEVLSVGSKNGQRDREVKLKLYSLYGVREYWIAGWRMKTIEVYRRQDAQLKMVATLTAQDLLRLPNFAWIRVRDLPSEGLRHRRYLSVGKIAKGRAS